MQKIIALCNQKGGVGKTTTAVNLASNLALSGKKILLIDLDPQGNATSGLGFAKREIRKSVYNILMDEAHPKEVIIKTEIKGLSIIPSNIDLTGAEVEMVGVLGRENRLKKALALVQNDYNFIIIDCPPSLGLLTINALTAANSVLIPVQCEYYAMEGLSQLINTINLVKENLNQALVIEGVLLTMADYRANLTKEIIKEARNFFKEKVYRTIIPRNVKLTEAPGFGKPIALYDKVSIGAQKYEEFTKEFLGEKKVEEKKVEEKKVEEKKIEERKTEDSNTLPKKELEAIQITEAK